MRFLSTLIASTLGTFVALGALVFLLFFFMFAVAATSDQAPRVRTGSVLVVPLGGAIPEILSDDPFTQSFGGGPSYDLLDLKQAFRKAAADQRVEGIWLQMSPLATGWGSLEELRSSLLEFKESGKFIVASSDDRPIGEGALFLSSVADEVYASAQAPFEFNGFYIAAEFYKNMLDKLDIEAQPVRAGKYKSAIEPYLRTNLSDENKEQLSSLLKARYDVFISAISESRGLKVEEVKMAMEEKVILTATDAYREGLLTDLLFQDEVENVVRGHLNIEEGEDIREISIKSYINVPSSDAGLSTGSDGEIAVVYAVGAIMSGESGYSANPLLSGDIVGSETFIDAMQEAKDSDRVKAIVVRVNSPGGSAAASDAMWREISKAAVEKPVIISMGDVAASGGYWIATAGDMIVANPLSITGSIGVFSMMLDMSGFWENKVGITFDVLRTGPYADMYSGTRGLSPEEIRLLEISTDETYESFLELVAESRNMTPEEVDALGQGRVWTGVEAKEKGLVDRLGTLEDAVKIAAEQASLEEGSYGLRLLPRPKTVFEQLEEALEVRAGQAWMNFTLSPTEQLFTQEKNRLSQLLELNGTVQALWPLRLTIE
ncbi:MAG: signal peptide peptidase SppA [Rhodothermaceae bacterium]|nr:signal peptide peptidase SppA [Rhodothermaceae bacterium]